MKEILSNERTKRNLTTYFMYKLEMYFRERSKYFVIAGNGQTIRSRHNNPSFNNHEEADTLIPYCLHEIGGNRMSPLVYSNNTNVFVLLVSHASSLDY